MKGSASGKSSFDASDLIIPRVALMQGISPPVMQGLVENAHFWHTINEEDLGTQLQVVCLVHRKQWTIWRPLHEGGGVIARASDGKTWDSDFSVEVAPYKDMPKKKVTYAGKKGDVVSREVGLGRWGTVDPDNEDSGPAATLSHIFLFRALDHMEVGPFIVFCQKTAEKVAKQLLTKINLADTVPIYGQVFTMGSVVDSNPAGQDYNQYTFRKNGFIQGEELFRSLEKQHAMYDETAFRTNDEDAQAEDSTAGDKGGPAAPDTSGDKY